MPTPRILIGLTGHAGAGKDTAASYIINVHTGNGTAAAFADALRAEVCAAFSVDLSTLSCRATKETPLPALALANCSDTGFVQRVVAHYAGSARDGGIKGERVSLHAPRSPREIMQLWGTEYRRHAEPNYWIDRMRERIATASDDLSLLVITDVRFANEAALVRELGGKLMQITRPGTAEAATPHVSETSGAQFAPDAEVVNRGSLDDFRWHVADALEALFPGSVEYEEV